ncbi:MAG: zinc ribbon domain-containing protein [Candidatus Aminicenantes bacterium]|nr:zinc ribbon domain-containing protein [Candidatus Aminicenantes bacterium]
MPLYEYECKKCHKTFDVLQKIDAEPLEKCIHCNGKVEKLISVSSFQFKGSGWYVTDYKNKKGKTDTSTNKDSNKGNNKNAAIK